MKTNTTVCIEADLLNWAKKNNINMSKTLSKKLENMRSSNKEVAHALNIEIHKEELEKLEKKTEELIEARDKKRQLLQEYEEKLNKEREKQMQEELTRLENEKHCMKCNRKINAFIELKGVKYHLCSDCLNAFWNKKQDFEVSE